MSSPGPVSLSASESHECDDIDSSLKEGDHRTMLHGVYDEIPSLTDAVAKLSLQ